MNELKLYENNDKIIDFQYDILADSIYLSGDIDIEFLEDLEKRRQEELSCSA